MERKCCDCGGSMFWEHERDVRCAKCRQARGRDIALKSIGSVVDMCVDRIREEDKCKYQ